MTVLTFGRLELARRGAVLVGCLLIALAAGAEGATVEVTTDVAVVLYLDGVEVERLDADDTVEFEVNDEEHELWVVATEAPGIGEVHNLRLLDRRTEEIEVRLADEVEDWLDSDEDDRALAPWASHLASRGDGVLMDPDNGLMWIRVDNGKDIDWETARTFCEALTIAGCEWRLPTIEELETLVSRDSRFGLRVVEPIWLTACCAWSSEEHGSISAWYMGFDAGSRGFVTRDYADDARALCVCERGGE